MAYTATQCEDFCKELEQEIKNKYNNTSFDWAYGRYKDNHFGFEFGIKNVYNNYRLSSKRVRINITVDDIENVAKPTNEEMFFEYLKSNISIMESDVGEKLKYRPKNTKHRNIYFDYKVDDLTDNSKKVKAVNDLSDIAIKLMESTLKLWSNYP